MVDASFRTVSVELERSPYDVTIGEGALARVGAAARLGSPDAGRALLVIDDNLPEETVSCAREALEHDGFAVHGVRVHAVEKEKTLATFERVLVEAERARLDRGDVVAALGGGIVGDVAGFVASSLRRGVPVVQCPTTLLSMVDASVGGKTGVNLLVDGELRKNMVGAFWQPCAVLADTRALASLPARDLRSGLGECLKHGLLAGATDPGLWEWTCARLDAVLALESGVIGELIERGVRVKAAVVAHDEREESTASAGRAALNLGHTYAHAMETLSGLSPTNDPADGSLLHGEAVMLGLVASSTVAEALGRLSAPRRDEIRARVESLGISTRLRDLPGNEEMIARMASDKKTVGGRLRIVLPVEGQRVEILDGAEGSVVGIGWDAIREV